MVRRVCEEFLYVVPRKLNEEIFFLFKSTFKYEKYVSQFSPYEILSTLPLLVINLLLIFGGYTGRYIFTIIFTSWALINFLLNIFDYKFTVFQCF